MRIVFWFVFFPCLSYQIAFTTSWSAHLYSSLPWRKYCLYRITSIIVYTDVISMIFNKCKHNLNEIILPFSQNMLQFWILKYYFWFVFYDYVSKHLVNSSISSVSCGIIWTWLLYFYLESNITPESQTSSTCDKKHSPMTELWIKAAIFHDKFITDHLLAFKITILLKHRSHIPRSKCSVTCQNHKGYPNLHTN